MKWLALLLLLPVASAGFEVHSVTSPGFGVEPEIEEVVVEIDLDIDCESAWLQDPYTIDMTWVSEADVTGPNAVTAFRADCSGPTGITEKITGVRVKVPLSLPAYEPVDIDFTFTSQAHLTEASITHTGKATVLPNGVPAIAVAAFESNGTTAYLALDNVGNDDVTIEFERDNGTGLFQFPSDVTIPRGGSWQGNITGTLEPGSSVAAPTRITPFDSKGEEGPPVTVVLQFQVPHEPVGDAAVPVPVLLVPLALLLARRFA